MVTNCFGQDFDDIAEWRASTDKVKRSVAPPSGLAEHQAGSAAERITCLMNRTLPHCCGDFGEQWSRLRALHGLAHDYVGRKNVAAVVVGVVPWNIGMHHGAVQIDPTVNAFGPCKSHQIGRNRRLRAGAYRTCGAAGVASDPEQI